MKIYCARLAALILAGFSFYSCATNPYATTNKSYKKQVKAFTRSLRQTPVITPGADSLFMSQLWRKPENPERS